VRLLLDEQLSPKRIGAILQAHGHDVHALAGAEGPIGLSDADVLALAAAEKRILVTCDGPDFAALARTWAEEERAHAGLVVIWTMRNHEYAAIVEALENVFELYPRQNAWIDLVVAV
jgi:predicted nuclease of predicted toxin-antitoxin system